MSISSPTELPPGRALAALRGRILVFGAGGARGRELVRALLESGLAPARLELFARTRQELAWRGESLAVAPLPERLPAGELAFLCTPPAVARALAARLAGSGMRVVDLSGAMGGAESSLALAGMASQGVSSFTDFVRLPLPSVALVAPVLGVLERAVGLLEVDVFAVVSAALDGALGIHTLRAELVARGAAGGVPVATPHARVGNLRPLGAAFETRMADELRTLLARPELVLDVAALAGDLERCDHFEVKAHLCAPLEPETARELFAAERALHLEPAETGPVPGTTTGSGRIHVGRIRAGSRGPRSLCFSAAGDQLRAGSALAALEVAARLAAGA
jgi:aspartate-semialdehyde dehydrogenase